MFGSRCCYAQSLRDLTENVDHVLLELKRCDFLADTSARMVAVIIVIDRFSSLGRFTKCLVHIVILSVTIRSVVIRDYRSCYSVCCNMK